MNVYDASEQAYKRGYEAGQMDARKKGHWISLIQYSNSKCGALCSNCATEHYANSLTSFRAFKRFCSYCGADMRGEEE